MKSRLSKPIAGAFLVCLLTVMAAAPASAREQHSGRSFDRVRENVSFVMRVIRRVLPILGLGDQIAEPKPTPPPPPSEP